MQLQSRHTGGVGNLFNPLRRGLVNKHSNAQHRRRQLIDNRARCIGFDVAWTGAVEIKTQRVCAGLDSGERVCEIGDAADLNESHDRSAAS